MENGIPTETEDGPFSWTQIFKKCETNKKPEKTKDQ